MGDIKDFKAPPGRKDLEKPMEIRNCAFKCEAARKALKELSKMPECKKSDAKDLIDGLEKAKNFYHQLAAELIMEANGKRYKGRKFNLLDVHHLRKDEAVTWVKEGLERAKKTKMKVFTVITGWGKHSVGNPVLKPAVEAFLTDNGYFFEKEVGLFRVFLKRPGDGDQQQKKK